MHRKHEKPVSIERLNRYLSEIFPKVKTDWELSQDGTAVVSNWLDADVARSYKQELNQFHELKDRVQFLGYDKKLRLIIPVQVLLKSLPIEIF